MKDNEIRGIVLRWLYDHRAKGWVNIRFADSEELKMEDTARACEQLCEHGLIQWSPMRQMVAGGVRIAGGNAKLTAAGVDVVEETRTSPLSVLLDHSMNVNISNSNGVQVGHGSSQEIGAITLSDLRRRIDEQPSSSEDKAAAKGLWNKLFEHPLVAAVVGGVSSNLKFD